jgi:hypothetical protein
MRSRPTFPSSSVRPRTASTIRSRCRRWSSRRHGALAKTWSATPIDWASRGARSSDRCAERRPCSFRSTRARARRSARCRPERHPAEATTYPPRPRPSPRPRTARSEATSSCSTSRAICWSTTSTLCSTARTSGGPSLNRAAVRRIRGRASRSITSWSSCSCEAIRRCWCSRRCRSTRRARRSRPRSWPRPDGSPRACAVTSGCCSMGKPSRTSVPCRRTWTRWRSSLPPIRSRLGKRSRTSRTCSSTTATGGGSTTTSSECRRLPSRSSARPSTSGSPRSARTRVSRAEVASPRPRTSALRLGCIPM